jgi:hypothetical protein
LKNIPSHRESNQSAEEGPEFALLFDSTSKKSTLTLESDFGI